MPSCGCRVICVPMGTVAGGVCKTKFCVVTPSSETGIGRMGCPCDVNVLTVIVSAGVVATGVAGAGSDGAVKTCPDGRVMVVIFACKVTGGICAGRIAVCAGGAETFAGGRKDCAPKMVAFPNTDFTVCKRLPSKPSGVEGADVCAGGVIAVAAGLACGTGGNVCGDSSDKGVSVTTVPAVSGGRTGLATVGVVGDGAI